MLSEVNNDSLLICIGIIFLAIATIVTTNNNNNKAIDIVVTNEKNFDGIKDIKKDNIGVEEETVKVFVIDDNTRRQITNNFNELHDTNIDPNENRRDIILYWLEQIQRFLRDLCNVSDEDIVPFYKTIWTGIIKNRLKAIRDALKRSFSDQSDQRNMELINLHTQIENDFDTFLNNLETLRSSNLGSAIENSTQTSLSTGNSTMLIGTIFCGFFVLGCLYIGHTINQNTQRVENIIENSQTRFENDLNSRTNDFKQYQEAFIPNAWRRFWGWVFSSAYNSGSMAMAPRSLSSRFLFLWITNFFNPFKNPFFNKKE